MNSRAAQFQLGIGACIASVFLALVAIPGWVSTPSNVPNVILSPLFWPYTLAGLTGLTGLGIIVSTLRGGNNAAAAAEPAEKTQAAWLRLAAMAVIMAATMYALPRLGMVWTCMLVFTATAFLIKTRHPRLALVCAVAVPLVLYAFFAHIAGVAVPQGDFVRLP
ncbi:MAG: tripartite tricarboxylate transporter TctB family protein [Hyphomicrobiales bacterium]|nr:tripartite tricarboxylate transporter TctB family protein [Hyphomicrobiales bacterium]